MMNVRSTMEFCLYAIVLMYLGGCAQYEQNKRNNKSDQILAECDASYPAIRGNYVKRVICLDRVQNARLSGNVDDDLLSLFFIKRRLIATDADAGRISHDTYSLRVAQAQSDMFSASESRNSRRSSNTAAALGAISNFHTPVVQPYVVQPYLPPQSHTPITTNCYRYGNTTNCVSQ